MKKLIFTLCALVFCSVSAFAADNVLSDEEKADGFQLIFNGQTSTAGAATRPATSSKTA